MRLEPQTLEGSFTEPDLGIHPLKAFLRQAGIDVATFPKVMLYVETGGQALKSQRVYMPIPSPRSKEIVYESFFRIVRTLEVPSSTGRGHRKFLEIEWTISEEPQVEEERHAALSFV